MGITSFAGLLPSAAAVALATFVLRRRLAIGEPFWGDVLEMAMTLDSSILLVHVEDAPSTLVGRFQSRQHEKKDGAPSDSHPFF